MDMICHVGMGFQRSKSRKKENMLCYYSPGKVVIVDRFGSVGKEVVV